MIREKKYLEINLEELFSPNFAPLKIEDFDLNSINNGFVFDEKQLAEIEGRWQELVPEDQKQDPSKRKTEENKIENYLKEIKYEQYAQARKKFLLLNPDLVQFASNALIIKLVSNSKKLHAKSLAS